MQFLERLSVFRFLFYNNICNFGTEITKYKLLSYY